MTSSVYSLLDLVATPGSLAMPDPSGAAGDLNALLGDPELAAIIARWTHEVGTNFDEGVDTGKINAPPTRQLSVTFLGKPATFTVRLGIGLLEDLIKAYGVYGWAGVDAAVLNLKKETSRDDPVEQFIARTHRTVTRMVLIGLDRIERAALTFAESRWKKAHEELKKYRRLVREPRDGDLNLRQFSDFFFGLAAVDECKKYAKKLAPVKHWDRQLKKWPTSAGRDPSSPYRSLWVKAVEEKAAALQELTDALALVAAMSPALALAVGSLDLDSDFGEGDRRMASGTLATAIYFRTNDLIDDTENLLAGLKTGPIVARMFASATTPGGQLELVAAGGLEAILVDELSSSGNTQRIMLNDDLLKDLADPAVADSPFKEPSWERFVLRVHRRDLNIEADKKAARDATFAWIWTWLGRTIAFLGVIAFLAVFPFSGLLGAAAAPALMALLEGAAVVASTVGLAMLAVESGLALILQRSEVSDKVRAKLYQVGASDPAALAAIGGLMRARSQIVADVFLQLLETAVTMGASKIKALAAVLDVYGSFGDIETLFAPMPAAEPAGRGAR